MRSLSEREHQAPESFWGDFSSFSILNTMFVSSRVEQKKIMLPFSRKNPVISSNINKFSHICLKLAKMEKRKKNTPGINKMEIKQGKEKI